MNANKYQITFNDTEVAALALNPLWLDIPEYVKFLARQEALRMAGNIPIFPISKRLERKLERGMRDYKAGKARLLYTI